MSKKRHEETHKETVWCGECFKRYSHVDWAQPAAALQEHYLSGECPGMRKA